MGAAEILTTASSLVTGALWVFALVGVVGALFSAWTLDVVAAKESQPRWLAWLPLFSWILLARLAGCGARASLACACAALAGLVLASVLALGVASEVAVPFGVVWLLGLWIATGLLCMRIAERRGVHKLAGAVAAAAPLSLLFVFTPLLYPLALLPLAAWFYVVFHDGLPSGGPHPIAYPVALVAALAVAGPLGLLTRNVQQFNQALTHEMTSLAALDEEHRAAAGFAGRPAGLPLEMPVERVGLALARLPDPGLPALPASPAPALDLELKEPRPAPAAYVWHEANSCPTDTETAGAPFPRGLEVFCVRTGSGIRHGPYLAWHPNGELQSRGQYSDGVEDGLWVRYWDNGVRRMTAEFETGRQHGLMTLYDAMGYLRSESVWSFGQPAPR